MWVRSEPGELINLDHSHHVQITEHGAPKFQVEVVACIGSERYVLAHMPKIGQEGRQMALEYVNLLVKSLQQTGKLITTPLLPRHPEQVVRR